MTRTRPIGYYVHHHGAGHRARALAIAHAAQGRITLIGTGLAGAIRDVPYLDLADDRLPGDGFAGTDGTATRPGALHYAPLDHAGIRARVAAFAHWIASEAPALIVVDVSAEIAMLARLASVPTVVVRLSGARTDPAHREAFRGAAALLCPFAAALDDPATPTDVIAKTHYRPGLVERPPLAAIVPHRVTVVIGGGGGSADPSIWSDAARTTPDLDWHVLGPCEIPDRRPPNLTVHGWVADAPRRIAESAIVIGSAGDGIVATALATGRPFVCLPEDRPFGEQRAKAAALARVGAAIICDDPRQADWPSLIERARRIDPEAAALLDDPQGAQHAAAWLIGLADRGGIA